MKTVHLICNAHIDPIWQWEWEEGAAAALSTFRSAVDLADEFDYIFCHNEVTLYKYIEEYTPDLFARIKKLIREGKWHVMGGWYLQPDCNMPSGESFIRQIQVGHAYFMEKFGVNPTTAINFDPFGHTRGLVQIMNKCGQDSYILCRAGSDPIPAKRFLWEGFDGSRVKVNVAEGYNSPLGHAAEAISGKAARQEEDTVCVLWGVGNHGGGPSRKDLADIKELIDRGEMKILHSTPEQFFAEIDPKIVHDKSLRISMPGCYTSMARIKQKHAELENTLYTTEKLCSAAALAGLITYPEKELDEAVEDLLNCEFHDVLPGSSIRAGEENGLRIMEHGLHILNHLRAQAFFAFSAAQPKAKEGEFPVLVFNPQPYEWDTQVLCELMLADQNWDASKQSKMRIYDADGNEVPAQVVKEESNLNLDWRKRFVFRAKLAPMTVTRYSLYVDYEPAKEKVPFDREAPIVLDLPGKHVEISRKTGLLTSYKIDGTEYVRDGAFEPRMYSDNADPWGMGGFQLTRMGSDPRPFTLMREPDGPFTGLQPVEIIEDGELYLGVEAFFICENTRVRVEYDIDKHSPAIDVKVDVFASDANRLIRLAIPSALAGTYIGQTAFGTEPLYMDGRECVAQRFVAVRPDSGKCLALFNRGTYASVFEDGTFAMTLLRTATYCAHPIGNRELIPTDRFVKKIDMGERNFAFRLTVSDAEALDRLAAEFNLQPYALNVFPVERDVSPAPLGLAISDRDILLAAMKKRRGADGYLLRLYNGAARAKDVSVSLRGAELGLSFGKFEVKTVVFDGTALSECPQLII